jgi:serine phosphatase RsbU (regulator of sigma subunit)
MRINITNMDINFYKEQLQAKEDMLARTTQFLVEVQESLKAKNVELSFAYRNIMDSISVAERIQKSLLPNIDVLKAYFKDACFKVIQQTGIGGDSVFIKNNNDGVIFGLLDSTGHGIPAAMLNISCTLLLKELMSSLETNNPKSLFSLLDVQLNKLFERDEYTFAQADGILFGYRSSLGYLSYCSAKGKALLARKSGEVEALPYSRKSIGDAREVEFQTFDIDLSNATKLLLYSDGLTDQFGGGMDRKFSSAQVKELFKNNLDKSATELANLIEIAHINWKKDTRQTDDVSFMIIEF